MRSYGVPTPFLQRSSKFLKRYINFKTTSKCEFDAPDSLNFMSHPWIHIQLLNLEFAMIRSQLDSFRTFLKPVLGDVGMYYLRSNDCVQSVQHATSTCMIAHLQRSRSHMCAKWPQGVVSLLSLYMC